MLVTLAIDDTDSQYGGCTTHLTALLLKELSSKVRLADYPLLVRLNPNIPWRTRGNAATALRLYYDGDPLELLETAWQMAVEYTEPRPPLPGKSPGVVVAVGDVWNDWRLRSLYHRALYDVVQRDIAISMLDKAKALYRGGRGLVGAAAALAALAPGDPYTFELTFYRRPETWGTRRCVNYAAAVKVEGALSSSINNVDLARSVVSAAPGGPDPVLAGFRGLSPTELWAYEEVLCERPQIALIYRSNQHTGVHVTRTEPRPYRSVLVKGLISSPPKHLAGGHVVAGLKACNGTELDVVFYRETGPLVDAAELLAPGDEVEVIGGVRPYRPSDRPVIAVEELRVLSLAASEVEVAPRCPRCGHRMESIGREKGYRCPRCGYRDLRAFPTRLVLPRRLLTGEYTAGLGRLRHLAHLPGLTLPTLRYVGGSIDINDVMRSY